MAVATSTTGKDRRINLRATSAQESLICAAAERRGVSMTDFVLESACTRAEEAIADQVHFVLPPNNGRHSTRHWSARRACGRGCVNCSRSLRFWKEPEVAGSVLTGPEKLTGNHRLDAFTCGIESLDNWLKRFALLNQQSDLTTTYVVDRNQRTVGYYSLTAGSALPEAACPPCFD